MVPWANAFLNLQDAIDANCNNDILQRQERIYRQSTRWYTLDRTTDRNNTFTLLPT
jgi:hypothetical protein